MDIEFFRNYCLQKKGVEECMPFGPGTLVFKVMGKMFALVGLDRIPHGANLKCDPEEAIRLREEYPGAVIPGYHMNKNHWNTVYIESEIPDAMIVQWINDSYNLIVQSLSKKDKAELELL